VVTFKQTWEGLEVIGADVKVAMDKEGKVLSLASSTQLLTGLSLEQDVGTEAAARAAHLAVFGREASKDEERPAAIPIRKAVLAGPGTRAVVYRVVLPTPMLQKWVCLVDAATGKVLKKFNQAIR